MKPCVPCWKPAFCAGIVAVFSAIPGAEAQWLQSATGTYGYTDTANWTDGAVNGVFPSSLTISGTVIANFATNTTLTTDLRFLQLQATTGSKLVFQGSGAGNQTLTLAGNVLAYSPNFGSYNGTVGFGSGASLPGPQLNVNLGGATRVIDSWLRTGGNIGFDIAGGLSDGGITQAGPGSVTISGSATFAGPLTVERGVIRLLGSGTLATQTINLRAGNGFFGSNNVGNINGALIGNNRDNSTGIGNGQVQLFNRVPNNATINSSGGVLQFGAGTSVSGTETVGTVNLMSGASTIAAVTQTNNNSASTDASMTVGITTLNRSAGATAVFGGSGKGLGNGWSIGQTPGTVGGNAFVTFGDGTAQNVGGIIPWGVIGNTQTGIVNGNALAFTTYSGTAGIQPYGYTPAVTGTNPNVANGSGTEIAGAYASTLGAATLGSGNLGNVRLAASDTTDANYTINSLTLSTAGNVGVAGRTITINSGAVLSQGGASTILSDLDSNGAETILYGANTTDSISIRGQIRNSSGVTISGNAVAAGFTTLPSTVNFGTAQTNYSGPTIVNSGILRLQVANALPTDSAVRVDPNGMINLNSTNQEFAALSGDGKVVFSNPNTGSVLTTTLTLGGGNTDTTFSGLIAPTFFTGTATGGNLVKVGTGSLTLSGVNSTYSGTTSVANGSLIVANNALAVAPNRTVSINTTTDLITLVGHGLTDGQTVMFTSNNSNPLSTNSVFQPWNPMVVANATADTFQVSPVANGGVVDFTSTGGVVQVMVPGALGSTNTAIQLGVAGVTASADNISLLVEGGFTMARAITVNNQNSAGTTTIGGKTADASTFSGTIILNRAVAVTAAAGGSSTFSGAISGDGGLRKIDAGAVLLTGPNTYTGATVISAGTLALGVDGSFANSTVITVGDAASAGATLDLTAKNAPFMFGAGQTLSGGGTVLVAPGQQLLVQGTFSPGNSPGLLTLDGGTTVLSGTTLMEIFGTSRATSPSHGIGFYDAVNVINSGSLEFGGNLTFDFSELFANNTTFDLFSPVGGSALAGNFTGVTVTGSFYTGLDWSEAGGLWKSSNTTGGQSLEFSSLTGQLVIVPEPGAIVLAGIGIAAASYVLRRRK